MKLIKENPDVNKIKKNEENDCEKVLWKRLGQL